jgi:hypothetical protein
MLSSPHMIEAAIMDQIVREAAMGIGDILKPVAAQTAAGCVPRADRPDLLVVDPALAPLSISLGSRMKAVKANPY